MPIMMCILQISRGLSKSGMRKGIIVTKRENCIFVHILFFLFSTLCNKVLRGLEHICASLFEKILSLRWNQSLGFNKFFLIFHAPFSFFLSTWPVMQ
jgi:hypothetical protein